MAKPGPIRGVATGRRRLALVAGGAGGAAALAFAALVVFQDNIAQFRLNPRVPFQTQAPPPAPDYDQRASWALWPDAPAEGARAEVFYAHSTTYYSNESWNAPLDDAGAVAELRRNAMPNEAGPFLGLGPVFAPHYRQATLFSIFTHKFDGVAARKLAYSDIKAAFEGYLQTSDPKLPIVLVGYGEGGLGVLGLLKDYFGADDSLRRRLAAAYVIDQGTPLSLFDSDLSKTPPCSGPGDIRCVVSYVDYEPGFTGEMMRARQRSMVWSGRDDLRPTTDDPLLCVNPLTWTITDKRAEAERHVGAASATGLAFGSAPPGMPKMIGAACIDGVLVVDRPAQPFLQRGTWFSEKWRARGYNLFYYDLAADAERRVAAAAARMEEEYRRLDPIAESVDVGDSPINQTPH